MRAILSAALLTASAVLFSASCASESQNNPASSGGGAGAGGSGATGGTATGGTAGSTGGDAGIDAAPNPCAFSGDAGDFGKWPDSKTKLCAGSSCSGQDGAYELNVPSYTPSAANSLVDTVTGLEWRKDVQSSDVDWSGAAALCNILETDGGLGKWRLPTRLELVSLMDFGGTGSGASLLPVEFDAPSLNLGFWTATAVAGDDTQVWTAAFDQGGSVGGSPKTPTKMSARCVRGTTPKPALVANTGCGTVTDTGLGLMWQREAAATKLGWAAAIDHCEGLTLAGFDDWRLPSAKELMTIVDDTKKSPAIDESVFGTTVADGFWSSTPHGSSQDQARVVEFDGGASLAVTQVLTEHVRCVRSLP